MKQVRSKRILACLMAMLFVGLADCSAVLEFLHLTEKRDPNSYPGNYRTDLLDYLRHNPTDMTSARDAYISAPSMKQFGSDSRYFVCLKANDEGSQLEKIAVFLSGQIVQFVDAGEQCRTAFYQPFPELVAMLAQAGGKR